MSYSETKVYFDGSHYIAIPHTERPTKKRTKPIEEDIIVEENEGSPNLDEPSALITQASNVDLENIKDKSQSELEFESTQKKKVKSMTKKQLFEELYMKYIDLKKRERKNKIIEEMKGFFEDYEKAKSFVETNFDRKQRNLICRRVRMCRKANLANFNYFCTFTYDDKLHTEQSFKKKLKYCFANLCRRKKWRYMGVWERAPHTNRLHFHGLFGIPDGSLSGIIETVRDYDTKSHRMQVSFQSTFFNKRFGRSDFKLINTQADLSKELSYIMKYLEKTGEKVVYSKNLPQFFISDIMDEDVVTTIGQEDKKLLLFDDFNCWDEGVLMGKVCPEVIERLRKCN